ncbi:hypothetical protein KCP77_04290 [Salmonella enterica subsp. enterica]|nr:hypothetical protein KCP77_04290 [Salmonella enterica subsp. enterica]
MKSNGWKLMLVAGMEGTYKRKGLKAFLITACADVLRTPDRRALLSVRNWYQEGHNAVSVTEFLKTAHGRRYPSK